MRFLTDRLVLARALRPAGAAAVAALSVVLLVSACVPAGIAASLGAVVSAINGQGSDGLLAVVIVPLAAFGVVILAGHIADAAAQPLESLARARIDGAHRTRILDLTTSSPTIGPLETPSVQRLVRQAAAEPDHGVTSPADGALAQLRWIAGLAGAAAACVVLARYAWWLIPLLVIPALIGLVLRGRQYFAAVASLRDAMKEELHADVWRNAASSAAEGKDVRLFGFADWMIDRMQAHISAGNEPFWRHGTRLAQRSWQQFALVLAGLAPAYVLVSADAAQGTTTVAVQTAVLVAGWSVFGSVGSGQAMFQMAGAVEVLRARDELRRLLIPHRVVAGLPMQPTRRDGPPLVRFEGVRFRYPETEHAVLDGLDLEIRPGELLAIVGLNGAGKSTLIKLLAGLYTPDAGRITADGTDIGGHGWEAWRRRITIVFQDFIRYQLPAVDNVMLGQASVPADRSSALAAAAEAGFDEVFGRLPDGWETPLARSRTGGVDLSGGQWQQVVLARALYAVRTGARILVLDEPTAHLDVRTEFEVFSRLTDHRGTTSVVLISHRLSTVRQADRIVLLDGGRITENGTHDELMALGGGYAELFTIQAERFQRGEDEILDQEAVA